jgi:transposase InsO family protein
MGHQHLQRLIDEYVDYYNEWRPHRSSINQLHVDAREGGLARRLD